MAKTSRKRAKRQSWTKRQISELRTHSRQKSPVVKIAKSLKRSEAAVRQKALRLGLPLGHRR